MLDGPSSGHDPAGDIEPADAFGHGGTVPRRAHGYGYRTAAARKDAGRSAGGRDVRDAEPGAGSGSIGGTRARHRGFLARSLQAFTTGILLPQAKQAGRNQGHSGGSDG